MINLIFGRHGDLEIIIMRGRENNILEVRVVFFFPGQQCGKVAYINLLDSVHCPNTNRKLRFPL